METSTSKQTKSTTQLCWTAVTYHAAAPRLQTDQHTKTLKHKHTVAHLH